MPYAQAALHLLAGAGYLGLLAAFGVAALGVGAPIPVTALLLTLGALSGEHGGPNIGAVVCVALLGLCAGHAGDYWCGRLGNRVLVRRLAKALERLGGTQRLLDSSRRMQMLLLFASRFLLTPVASPVSLLAGVTRLPFTLYLALEVPGTALYACGNLAIGRALGPRALGGSGLLVFWLVVAALMLLPVGVLRLVARSKATAQPLPVAAGVAIAGQGPRTRRARAAAQSASTFARRSGR